MQIFINFYFCRLFGLVSQYALQNGLFCQNCGLATQPLLAIPSVHMYGIDAEHDPTN